MHATVILKLLQLLLPTRELFCTHSAQLSAASTLAIRQYSCTYHLYLLPVRVIRFRHSLVDGVGEGVGYPTYSVRVRAVAVSKVGGAPAADWQADKLLGGYDESESDQHGCCVLSRHSVCKVVVSTRLEFTETSKRLYQLVCCHGDGFIIKVG